ncbi:DUF4159 domain-containing protein [Salibacteraceae bacterium]|nr:DUF4159 domain-containing protein [Salibacteraceae bacterium]MDB4104309.1 DUF4159 domain-containing protein [Salibacteraceae bacterium]MDB9709467.1 DUF4159 domain-containing protein [Salibacteraceae bacterium]MDC1303988.1 DUF4159 domain-containing protein [Salibacteraceae bacterium]
MKRLLLIAFLLANVSCFAQDSYKIALVKYSGGGDWYANLETSLPNLIEFCNRNLGTNISKEQDIVEVGDRSIFNYPFVHLTGHGNISFNDQEAQNLRKYLTAGGFLHIDDNYGIDPFIRAEMQKVFPELEFIELPPSHPIFHQKYNFKDGLPKIHEHDNKPPQAFGLYFESRLVCLYTYESDLGDGWEDPRIHNDTQSNHEKALKMGANIIEFVFLSNEQAG